MRKKILLLIILLLTNSLCYAQTTINSEDTGSVEIRNGVTVVEYKVIDSEDITIKNSSEPYNTIHLRLKNVNLLVKNILKKSEFS